jgi:hypothetical protein
MCQAIFNHLKLETTIQFLVSFAMDFHLPELGFHAEKFVLIWVNYNISLT